VVVLARGRDVAQALKQQAASAVLGSAALGAWGDLPTLGARCVQHRSAWLLLCGAPLADDALFLGCQVPGCLTAICLACFSASGLVACTLWRRCRCQGSSTGGRSGAENLQIR